MSRYRDHSSPTGRLRETARLDFRPLRCQVAMAVRIVVRHGAALHDVAHERHPCIDPGLEDRSFATIRCIDPDGSYRFYASRISLETRSSLQ
jgi:hypothetical protein